MLFRSGRGVRAAPRLVQFADGQHPFSIARELDDLLLIASVAPDEAVLVLEQAYVTANIGIGNGMEFLIGKFNAPVGVEFRENP